MSIVDLCEFLGVYILSYLKVFIFVNKYLFLFRFYVIVVLGKVEMEENWVELCF